MSAYLKQDEPDNANRLDNMRQGVLGTDASRIEGLLKVTGTAPYAAEYQLDDCLEGVLVTATISKGEVTAIDADSVLSMPGVVTVIDDPALIARPAQGTAGEAPE